MQIPEEFNVEFLEWFRDRTESAWAQYRPKFLQGSRRLGCDWIPGTRWLGGLSAQEIEEVERAWSLRFPPDYRLFLSVLHAVDHPMQCSSYQGDSRVLIERPAFYNWLTDSRFLKAQYLELTEGLISDVSEGLWLPCWGPKPRSRRARESQIQQLVAEAPKLIPVFSHRFLLIEPCLPGNPVFSISQSDVVLYGRNIRHYLLREFATLLEIEVSQIRGNSVAVNTHDITAIPFWGEIFQWNLQQL